MIILSNTTDSIQVVLGATVATSQLQCVSAWRDITSTSYIAGRTLTNTNNLTDVTVVASPGSNTQRVIDFMSVYNNDTATSIVTIKFDANGTEYPQYMAVLQPNESLVYTEKEGFITYTSTGEIKLNTTYAGVAYGDMNIIALTGDITNSNAVANTIAGLTGLEFTGSSGSTYWFKFLINYTGASVGTGSRWTITGPTFSFLSYTSRYTLTSTTETINTSFSAYDLPAASNASSLTAGNIAIVEGIVVPRADGVIRGRFASEVSGSAIVAKAGSILHWQKII